MKNEAQRARALVDALYESGTISETEWKVLSGKTKGMAKVFNALADIYEWYDRDGSVGGASEVFEEHRAALAALEPRP